MNQCRVENAVLSRVNEVKFCTYSKQCRFVYFNFPTLFEGGGLSSI